MEYRVRVYIGEKIQDVSLVGRNKWTLGGADSDDCQVKAAGIEGEHFLLYKRNGRWFAGSKDETVVRGVSAFSGTIWRDREIKDGDIFLINREEKIAVYIFGKNMDFMQVLDLMGIERAAIGRGAQCDLILAGNDISRQHAVIQRENGAYVLMDNHSLNGTFLNHKKIKKEYLNDGDLIGIGHFSIRFFQERLTVNVMEEENSAEEKQVEYPHWFKCAPRLQQELPGDVINIENPPQEVSKPERSLFSTIASPAVMMVVMVIMVILSVMSPVMLVFTVPMSLISICMAVVGSRTQKKKYEEKVRERNTRYSAYLDIKEKEIEKLKIQQKSAMLLANPDLTECVMILKNKDTRLWNRHLTDGDFMQLRSGVGEGSISFEVRGQKKEFTMEDDPLLERTRKIIETAQYMSGVPVLCDVSRDKLIGVIGERQSAVWLVKNMILQAATHHPYEELKIVTIYSHREAAQWDWVRWLPHSFDEMRENRFVSSTRNSAETLLKDLEGVLKQRSMESKEDILFSPYYFFVFTEMEMVQGHPVMKYLLNNERNIGAGAVFLYDDMSHLPKECNIILEVEAGQGVLFHKHNVNFKRKFQLDFLGEKLYEEFARTMAPLRIAGEGAQAMLPACVSFMEGYGVRTPSDFQLERMWKCGRTNESMAVPIGVKANGEPFLFDIHEKKFGPHGLVAGMTGSGKSEMVQSWILSMALRFSPKDVSFVLIDFKGTGLLLPFSGLPHLAGTISDLDSKIQRNLLALENELSRRKELLDKYNVNNINNYLKLYHGGKAPEPLAYLFVVIDEFAEFKIQFPDFMKVVDRIFAIGRTLGVFAILMTQKPAGVVDDKMNANTRFRWCLKVASSADSKEMLRHPDAAKITTPGRAYVQVGEDEVYELVQSYYSGAPYRPEAADKLATNLKVAIVEENGRRIYYENEVKKQVFEGEKTEISEIVSYLHTYAVESGVEGAKQIWLPKLSCRVYLEDIQKCRYENGIWHKDETGRLCPVAGIIDDPVNQSQYPLVFDFTKDGHIAVFGAPGTGKTTLLQTVVMSLIWNYSPEDVNIYLMDFGGWNMGIFRQFPHVGGIANDNEEIKIEKLIQLLERKLVERKEKFSDIGVGSCQAYRQATGEKIPDIVLILDNFAPVLQLYPDMDSFFIRLTREGGNYGIYFLVSANNPMALGFKVNQNIKMAVALNMSDKSDYQGIVGRTNGLEPESEEGRGLVKGNPPLEFQTALPAYGENESERVRRIKGLAEEMSQMWKGRKAFPIPIMPANIAYGSIAGPGIKLGFSVKEVEAVYLPESGQHYLPVVGTVESGKSNMLRVLAKQFQEREEASVVYVDVNNSPFISDMEGCHFLTEMKDFDYYMQNLVPVLQERKSIHDKDKNQRFEPIAIFIDDYRTAYEQMQEMTAKRLEAIIRLGAGLDVFLYIAEEADTFCRLYAQGEPVSMLMVKENRAILLGGSFTSYPVFHSEMSGLEKNQVLGEWEGYWLDKGKTIRFKAMSKD